MKTINNKSKLRLQTLVAAKDSIRRDLHKAGFLPTTSRHNIQALTNLRHSLGICKSSRLPLDLA